MQPLQGSKPFTGVFRDKEHSKQYEFIVFTVAKMRAFSLGLSEGFYGDKEALGDADCMNDFAIDALFNLYEGFVHGKGLLDTFFKTITAWYVLTVHLRKECSTARFVYDATTYCFRSEQCDSFDIYLYNLSEHLTQIGLSLLQIISLLFQKPKNLH